MHKNTALVIFFLSVIAALLLGMNLGRRIAGTSNLASQQLISTPSPTSPLFPISSPSPLSLQSPLSSPVVAGISTQNYTNTYCGISFEFPNNFTLQQASDAARLVDNSTQAGIDFACNKDIPKPPVPLNQVEQATIAGQLATIYHDKTAADGKSIDMVVFTHPKNNLQQAFFGFGENFTQLLQTIKLLP